MPRHPNTPLRSLTIEEYTVLEQISRAHSEPASHVARAKILLSVAAGHSFTAAAHAVGRRSGDAVAQIVARFNQDGVAALAPRYGGGPAIRYGAAECDRIVRELERPPDRELDGTASWSLSTLQHALRTAEDGLPTVSTFTIWGVLHDAGYTWQRSRTWCTTGTVIRKRKDGIVAVTDPDTAEKKA